MCSVWQPYGDKAGGGEVGGGGHPQVGGGGIGESAGGGGRENTTREGIDKALDQDYVFLFSDQVCYQVAKLSTRGEYPHIVEISTHLLKTGEIYIHFWTMSKRKMLFYDGFPNGGGSVINGATPSSFSGKHNRKLALFSLYLMEFGSE